MSVYQSNRDKVVNFLNKFVLDPSLFDQDLDYYKVLDEIIIETGSSRKLAEEILNSYIRLGKVSEFRFLVTSPKILNNIIKGGEKK